MLFIVVIYVGLLLPGCVALAYTDGWWARALFSVGVVVLAFEAVAIGTQQTAVAHDMSQTQWVWLIVVLAAMLATYACQIWVAEHWARHGLPRLETHLMQTMVAVDPDGLLRCLTTGARRRTSGRSEASHPTGGYRAPGSGSTLHARTSGFPRALGRLW